MKPLTYSWIGLSAASPLIFLICAFVLGVFHSYRKYWRSVDLFLLAIFVQELLTALQIFVYALLSLMQPSSTITCSAFIWSLSATRTLQAATVTSLLVDRALTSQWPYKYRFSVRRHQIRYHLVVLATMAALVGVAAILARSSETSLGFEDCRFLPHSLHVRLALFLLSLYGILLVISAISTCVVQTTRGCKGGISMQSDQQDMTPIAHGTTGSSTTTASSGRTPVGRPLHQIPSSASTSSSSSSSCRNGGLQSASSTTDLVAPSQLRPFHNRGTKPQQKVTPHRSPLADFRWKASLAVAGFCFFVNHLPYMCLLVIGTFFPTLLPEWPMENVSLWLSLFEGLVLPLVLGLCDPAFGAAVLLSCNRESSAQHKYESGETPFRNLGKEEVKSFPLTNGSLFSSLLTMNVDSPLHVVPSYGRSKGIHSAGMRMGISSHEIRGMVGQGPPILQSRLRDTFGQLFYHPEEPNSLGSIGTSHQDPIYSDPLNKSCSMDSSLKLTEDDHIYATLSETYGSFSSLSDCYLGDHHRCSSATTVANDDFEYHGPRMTSHDFPNEIEKCSSDNHIPFVSVCNLALSSRPPAELPPEALPINESYIPDIPPPSSNSSSSGSSPVSSFRSCSTSTDISCSENAENIRNAICNSETLVNSRSSPRLGFVNEAFERDSLDKTIYFDKTDNVNRDRLNTSLPDYEDKETLPKERSLTPIGEGTLSKKHRNSSLSMNDLDRFEPREPEQEEEMMFILPVKSESMLSLYRLYLAEDEDSGCTSLHYYVEISKSENDLSVLPNPDKAVPLYKHKSGSVPMHEIYQKKRVPISAASRIRRQNKIQRARRLQQRSRPILQTHPENPGNRMELNQFWELENDQNQGREGVQVAVMNKTKRKNGIITIKDPSVLSVEELFKVLDRASVSESHSKKNSKPKHLNRLTNNTYHDPSSYPPTTEYKKIFVSEYL